MERNVIRLNIAIGCDEAGYRLKQRIAAQLEALGHQVTDYGCFDEQPVLYPEVGQRTALAVAEGKQERGILICGTGIGMCITANKIPGIRAAVCHDCFSAVRARRSNDAQIMCLGARVIGPELAAQLVDIWLQNDFGGGGSAPKLEQIEKIEELYRKRS